MRVVQTSAAVEVVPPIDTSTNIEEDIYVIRHPKSALE